MPATVQKHALCPACGHMSCEHLAHELENLRRAARELYRALRPIHLSASAAFLLEELLKAAAVEDRHAETYTTTDRGSLEIAAVECSRVIGRELQKVLPREAGVGFAVLVFDFGGRGNLAYVSNAERSSMLQAMREFIGKAERDQVPSIFRGPRS